MKLEITRQLYTETVPFDQECGGDCWSDWYCYRQAFKYPNVASVLDLGRVGTGLYRDLTVRLTDGTVAERRIRG